MSRTDSRSDLMALALRLRIWPAADGADGRSSSYIESLMQEAADAFDRLAASQPDRETMASLNASIDSFALAQARRIVEENAIPFATISGGYHRLDLPTAAYKALKEALYPHPPAPAVGPDVREAWPEPKVTNPDIANPTGIPYIDGLIHQLLDAQQDINFAANTHMSQSLCDASALIDEVETAIRKLSALTRPLGGFVQGSIATKQATDETAASVLSEALDDVSSVYDEMCIQFSGVHADDRMDSLMLRLHSALKAFGREQVGTICAHEDGCPPFGGPCPSCEPRYQYSALAQLTKTPSADHDAGNLRGLAEPHHQPHALSQAAAFVAWAMREGPWEGGDLDGGTLQDKAEELGLIIKTAYEPDIHGPCDYGAEPGDDWFVLHPDIKAAANLPAPPVLENTPRDSSESTTGGVG